MAQDYCDRHDIDISELPNDYDYCPRCRQERDREHELMERATRDPTLEPY